MLYQKIMPKLPIWFVTLIYLSWTYGKLFIYLYKFSILKRFNYTKKISIDFPFFYFLF